MNTDISISLYRENADLKNRLDEYRSLVARVLNDSKVPEDIKKHIRSQLQEIEKKKT